MQRVYITHISSSGGATCSSVLYVFNYDGTARNISFLSGPGSGCLTKMLFVEEEEAVFISRGNALFRQPTNGTTYSIVAQHRGVSAIDAKASIAYDNATRTIYWTPQDNAGVFSFSLRNVTEVIFETGLQEVVPSGCSSERWFLYSSFY